MEKIFQQYIVPSECQTVWIQIRPHILSVMIFVQTVCKSYQQTTLVNKELKSRKGELFATNEGEGEDKGEEEREGEGLQPLATITLVHYH